jgi:hypothetical protein
LGVMPLLQKQLGFEARANRTTSPLAHFTHADYVSHMSCSIALVRTLALWNK